MMNEKEMQDRINRRLSGLAASSQRRARIRAAIRTERKEARPMKKTVSRMLLLAAAAVLLLAAAALAEHFSLFNFFGECDARYAAVAPYAALTVSEPALVEQPELGTAAAVIDSAYFDGLSLSLAYRITQGQHITEYRPAEAELALMAIGDAETLVADLSENEPGSDILRAWNQALETGAPYGYWRVAVYTSDHTVTDDGVDIYPDSAIPAYDANGDFCELREFACPLPEAVRERQEIKVSIGVKKETAYYWFDGSNCYWRIEHEDIGTMTAAVPRNGESRRYTGSGKISGVNCAVQAEASPMAAVMTITCDAPLADFLGAAPQGMDESDCWAEVIAVDENGHALRPQGGIPLDAGDTFTLTLYGTGALPKTVTVYLFSAWEGMDAPDTAALEGICLREL